MPWRRTFRYPGSVMGWMGGVGLQERSLTWLRPGLHAPGITFQRWPPGLLQAFSPATGHSRTCSSQRTACCPAQRAWWQQIWPGRPDSFKWLRWPPAAGTSCLTPALPVLLRSSSVVVSRIRSYSAPPWLVQLKLLVTLRGLHSHDESQNSFLALAKCGTMMLVCNRDRVRIRMVRLR